MRFRHDTEYSRKNSDVINQLYIEQTDFYIDSIRRSGNLNESISEGICSLNDTLGFEYYDAYLTDSQELFRTRFIGCDYNYTVFFKNRELILASSNVIKVYFSKEDFYSKSNDSILIQELYSKGINHIQLWEKF